jgi:NitT/TauT family transport system permease protein
MQFIHRDVAGHRAQSLVSRSDFIVIPVVGMAIVLLVIAMRGVIQPFTASTPDLTVSTSFDHLPYYALRSLFRMLVAVLLSLLFTFTYATIAAKSRRAEKVLIPVLDFLQSLPILGFLTVTTTFFLALFRNNLLGLEMASIFAIFTSQVWNMTFSFYHSLRTTPKELNEAAAVMHLSGWKTFWRLEVPFAMPGLIWNTMMSVSGGWFFVVASEVISVIGRENAQQLPGIGSFIALAIEQRNTGAMLAAGLTLLALVLLYDQLVFRPIVAWAEKFKLELSESQNVASSWVLTAILRARLFQRIATWPGRVVELLPARRDALAVPGPRVVMGSSTSDRSRTGDLVWNLLLAVGIIALTVVFARFLFGNDVGISGNGIDRANVNLNTDLEPGIAARFAQLGVPTGNDQTVYLSSLCAVTGDGIELTPELRELLSSRGVAAPHDLASSCREPLSNPGKVSPREIVEVARLGMLTMLRVVVMIVIASVVWVPVGVWIGLRPWATRIAQPLAQFLAAFPANLLFPIFVVLIARFDLAPNIWLAPLMVLGAQWYILFNVISGTIAIPNDLKEAAAVYHLRPRQKWRQLILPGIFPSFVTGGITASGGAWNASIVAEIASWGSTTLVATGLGAYIARWSTGEFNPHVALGMVAMGALVLAFNRLLWRRLYALAERRFRLD